MYVGASSSSIMGRGQGGRFPLGKGSVLAQLGFDDPPQCLDELGSGHLELVALVLNLATWVSSPEANYRPMLRSEGTLFQPPLS